MVACLGRALEYTLVICGLWPVTLLSASRR